MAKHLDIIVGSDHRGRDLKYKISDWLCPLDENKLNIAVFWDCGTHKDKNVDYPDVVGKFADYFDIYNKGILFCGSGYGVMISANKYPNIRAVVCRTVKEAEISRQHNDANVLCIGSDFTNFETAKKIVKKFLTTDFLGGRHKRRVKKINKILNNKEDICQDTAE